VGGGGGGCLELIQRHSSNRPHMSADVNTTEELLQQILNAAVLRTVTCSLVTPARKRIQTYGGNFEQIAWVLNGQSVTVHLMT